MVMAPTPRLIGLVAGLASIAAFATDASAWVARNQPGPGEAHYGNAMAIGPDGSPVAAGWFYGAANGFNAIKYASADGAELWSFGATGLASGSQAYATVVAVDASGDVAVGGGDTDPGNEYDGIVVKLSGADGSLLWRHDFTGADDQVFDSLAVFPDGDVAVVDSEGTFAAMTVMIHRLDGTTGNEEWATPIVGQPGSGTGLSIAVDAAGDVVFTALIPGIGEFENVTGKLAGTDGTEIWRTPLGPGYVTTVAVDPAGDVVSAGYLDAPAVGFQNHAAVAKLAGGTGTLLWLYEALPADTQTLAAAVAFDGTNVYATGRYLEDLLTVKLDGTTGGEIWRSIVKGSGIQIGNGIVTSAGVPIIAGTADYQFVVLSLDPATGDLSWIDRLPGGYPYPGVATAVGLTPGYIFAGGSSVFPLVAGDPTPYALTVERLIDPSAPPLVGTCTPAPRGDCRGPSEAGKAKLSLKDMPGARQDRLQWKISKGEATTLGDFGDPLSPGDDFTLCLYDGTNSPIFSVVVLGGGTCGSLPCWRMSGSTSLLYRAARPRDAEGLDRLKLTSGATAKMKVTVVRKGRGTNLDIPVPTVAGLMLPATIQLQQDGGNCFTSTFSAGGVIKHDAVSFKALSD
jgi:hypothetical protein